MWKWIGFRTQFIMGTNNQNKQCDTVKCCINTLWTIFRVIFQILPFIYCINIPFLVEGKMRSVAERDKTISSCQRRHWPPTSTNTHHILCHIYSVGLICWCGGYASIKKWYPFSFCIRYDKSKFCQLHAQCSSGPYCPDGQMAFFYTQTGHLDCVVWFGWI